VLGCAATLLVFAASVYGRETFMTGMETPLHVAIVFAAILAFLTRSPLLGFLCAAAITSKLDAAAPMVVLLGLDFTRSRTESIEWLRGMVLRFVLPLATWCAFAFLVFGSPLPQTLVAKQFFHPKATGGWFPFFQGMAGVNDISAHIIGACCLCGIAIAAVRRKSSACSVFALCGIATLVPYYFYNPGERMHWYYALPEVCFLCSALAFPAALREIVPAGRGALRVVSIGCAACLMIGALCARSAESETLLEWSRMYARLVETDRIAAGRALGAATAPGSTVYAGHGHIARESHRRVIDFSGLNSRFATQHNLSLASMFEAAPPAGIATHGLIPDALQQKYRLELRESFYNVTALGYEPFRVFAARPGGSPAMIASLLPHDAVVGGVWQGTVLMAGHETAFRLDERGTARLSFGLREAAHARTVLLIAETVDATRRCEIPAGPHDCAACTIECSVEVRNGNFLSELALAAIDGSPFAIIDPVIVRDAYPAFAIH
ncbi:MAG TPA: hypothetical protein VG496_12245, partial [Myxococcales bacterium]|nr:hypothetical protein [Myxococcales bacterium]